MLKQSGRILVILFALYGLVQLSLQIFPDLKNFFNDPSVINTPMVKGAIDYANQVLPESQQIKIPDYSSDSKQQDQSMTKTITHAVTEKVNKVTVEAIDAVKDSTQNQVCKALFQKLEAECNQ